jgi:hypothetical protein
MIGTLFSSALLLNGVVAFPHIAKMVEEKRQAVPNNVLTFPEYPGTPNHALFNEFDAAAQYVDLTGAHEFQAPGPGDIRGPCSGLNAAANHGFISRDGIATANDIEKGLWEAFSLDSTATIFLTTVTSFFNGDPVSGRWSIGPHSDKTNSLGVLGELLGNETGICAYGHLRSEGDASITRGDWLAPDHNSNCRSYPEFMQQLFDLSDQRADGLITPRVLAEHADNRKKHSIATNPNYFSPPYAGIAFTFGAHMFSWELMANHSAEFPRGHMTQQNYMDFFGYTRDASGNLQFNRGTEKIPDNWYKRSEKDPWTLADIGVSTAQQCVSWPSSCIVGGNTGTANSFQGVNPGDISGGLINNFDDLQNPDRLICFINQAILADTPSSLSNVLEGTLLTTALGMIDTKLKPVLAMWGTCPNLPAGRALHEYDGKFPGAEGPTSGPRSGE